ncbi:MAG: helix-turn-helix transcriptional regulator, partial [Gemmatimonadales bacterium]|nr:helix-turn-helix transcriptional regulator [Gemmatimonadales bacterium]
MLEAARQVFTRHGTSGARMQQIAAEAGVNQALIHYYFRTKQQLADRVFLEAVGRMSRGLAPALAAERTLEEVILRFVEGYIDAMRQTP